MNSPAVFLDRDGTLMEEVDYCGDPSKVRLLAGVVTALRELKKRGYRLVIVTNQSGIGRGYFTELDYQAVQSELYRQVDDPTLIDASYHCPDAPDHATNRRKPGTGMIDEAAADLDLDLPGSYLIGDTCNDILCGQRAGLAGAILVLTGHSARPPSGCEPDHITENLAAAAAWILGRLSRERGHPARSASECGQDARAPGGCRPYFPDAGKAPAFPGSPPPQPTTSHHG